MVNSTKSAFDKSPNIVLLTFSSKVQEVGKESKYSNYSVDELEDAKEDIRKGFTYTEATENRTLSQSTLHAQ